MAAAPHVAQASKPAVSQVSKPAKVLHGMKAHGLVRARSLAGTGVSLAVKRLEQRRRRDKSVQRMIRQVEGAMGFQ